MIQTIKRLALLWAFAGAAAAQTPIVVHHIGPLTGVLAGSNQEALDGARMYLDGLNARGGIGGRPLRLEALDDGQDAKRSAQLPATPRHVFGVHATYPRHVGCGCITCPYQD